MMTCFQEPKKKGLKAQASVTVSDLAYFVSFVCNYEEVFEWHRKEIAGNLKPFPDDNEEAKRHNVAGKQYYEKAVTNGASKKILLRKYYFEQKPNPKVGTSGSLFRVIGGSP